MKKLIWEVVYDGWTSIWTLCLLNEKQQHIWRSEEHYHFVNKELFECDLQLLKESYDGIDDSNIEKVYIVNRVT